jgi:hypothetical protein
MQARSMPNFNRAVFTAARQSAAIGAERRYSDFSRVFGESANFAPIARVQNRDLWIMTTARKHLPIGTEGHCIDPG